MKNYSRKAARLYVADCREYLESVPAFAGYVAGMLSQQAENHERQGHFEIARAYRLESRRAALQYEFA